MSDNKKKKLLTFNNLTTVLLVGLILGMVFVPEFKATLLRGIMKTGIFNPSVKGE